MFAADTIKLLTEDAKALKGDLGEIDVDWLCNCQDFTNIKATITVQSATPTTARATAEFHDSGEPDRTPNQDRFDLLKTNGTWRIHDIAMRGAPLSLRVRRHLKVCTPDNDFTDIMGTTAS